MRRPWTTHYRWQTEVTAVNGHGGRWEAAADVWAARGGEHEEKVSFSLCDRGPQRDDTYGRPYGNT